MQLTFNRKTVASLAAAALVAAGGATAVAAATGRTPAQENQTIIDDVANRLGIDASKVTAALKSALENRVDAALAAGQITQAQADRLKAQIEAGTVPFFAAGGGRGHGPGGPGHLADLDAAASYLGLTAAELRTQLASGKTLAEIASSAGKSVDGLVAALAESARAALAAEVSAGRLTQAQADAIGAGLEQRLEDLVNGSLPRFDRATAASTALT